MSLLIVGMDVTIVNVALPSIRRDFGASVSSLQWTTAAYTVVLASLLMLGGSTADRLGRARVFKVGLALFTAASLACALAPGVGWLIAFRVLQGAAGAMLNPVAMSIIRNTFEDPRERAQAIGIWGATVGISMALGPVLGGVLVELSWRAVFLVNIPIGLAAIALTARFVPESRAPRPRRPDPVGQVLVIVTLASLTSAIIEGPGLGWGSPPIVALALTAGVAFVALVRYELRTVDPLIELRFFASRPFAAATVIAVAAFTAFGGFLFLNTLYLQDVRGLSPASAGLYTLPIAAMTVLCSPIAGRVVGARGARGPLVVGGLGLGLGGLMLVSLSADTSLAWLLGAYCIFGLGFGAVNPPITNTAVSGMPPSQAGVAAAVATTSRQVGLTLGVAVVGAIVAAGLSSSLEDDLATATHAAWWLIAVLGAGIVALGLAASTASARSSAERTAARLDETPQEPSALATAERTAARLDETPQEPSAQATAERTAARLDETPQEA
jgi:EmrB/QacA subfamily drug resistance transporter